MKRRTWLWVPAAGFALWILWATGRWWTASPDLAAAIRGSWAAATSDWMSFLFLTDGMMFGLIAIGWMAADLVKRGASSGRCAAWVAAALVVGSPVVLVYLARRRGEDGPPPASEITGD